jgi:hypothetical protein
MKVTLEKTEKRKYFLRGFVSIYDLFGRTFIREDKSGLSGFQKDYLAMRGDWINIGKDMRNAMNYEKTMNQAFYGK